MPKKQPRVALALAVSSHAVSQAVWTHWLGVLREIHFPGPTYIQHQFYIKEARNRLVKNALEHEDEWDYLWMWDCDQAPNKFHVTYVNEVAEDGRDAIVGGLYFRREYPFEVIAYDFLPQGHKTTLPNGEAKEEPTDTFRPISSERVFKLLETRGLAEVDGCGTGDLLIRKDVLKRMAEEKGGSDIVFETPDMPGSDFRGGVWGEDLYFCYEAKQRFGYKIWLDTRRESAHYREQPITSQDYKASHQIHIPLEQFNARSKLWTPDKGGVIVNAA